MKTNNILKSMSYDSASQGGEYVKHARKHYQAAVSKLQKAGEEISTAILKEVVMWMVKASLGIE